MGCCSGRCTLIFICTLQLVSALFCSLFIGGNFFSPLKRYIVGYLLHVAAGVNVRRAIKEDVYKVVGMTEICPDVPLCYHVTS